MISAAVFALSASALWAQNGPGMNSQNSQPGQQPQAMNQPVPAQPATPPAHNMIPGAMPMAKPAPAQPVAQAAAPKKAQQGKAQELVNSLHAQYPNIAEIGLSAQKAHGCVTVASTDKKDVGEKCERDAVLPLKTGKTSIEKEDGRFAVSLPLRDMHGKIVGVLGLEFKPKAGQTKAAVLSQAKKIASQMGKKISSKSALLE